MRAQTTTVGGLEFWLVGSPELKRTADGSLIEYTPSTPSDQRLNVHAAGPFCSFGLAAAPSAPGVYAILVDGELKYIGRCEDLAKRFSARGYGHISARKLHSDGQSTNCKLNSKILVAAKVGTPVQVWFHSTNEFISMETKLIRELEPEWNGRSPMPRLTHRTIGPQTTKDIPASTEMVAKSPASRIPTKYDFDRELRRLLDEATARGGSEVEISAWQLHRAAGSYPGAHHRMPICCSRMRAAMTDLDRITQAPPKGNGASLTVKYLLPRRQE